MTWIKKSISRYERTDGAVVKYDESANTYYAKSWAEGHRGWMIYLPTEEYPVYYKTKRGMHVAIKFMTSEGAIKALEKLAPFKE